MNETRFDGSFEYNGQEVYYRINDELRDIKYKHGEPAKAQRFIHFLKFQEKLWIHILIIITTASKK